MPITREQAKVYAIILDMILKAIFSIAVIVVFVGIIYCYFTYSLKEWSQTVPLASLEAFLAGTMYVAFRHYFPNRDGKNDSESDEAAV